MSTGTGTTDGGVSVADDATAAPLSTAPWSIPTRGLAISGLETATGLMRVCRVNALGQLIVAGGGGGGGTPVPNEAAVTMQTVTVAVPGTPVQGPAVAIPDGFSVVVKNRSSQAGAPIAFVGNSNASVQVSATRVELLKGESLAYFITSMDLLFFDSDTAGDIIELTAEQ